MAAQNAQNTESAGCVVSHSLKYNPRVQEWINPHGKNGFSFQIFWFKNGFQERIMFGNQSSTVNILTACTEAISLYAQDRQFPSTRSLREL